MTNKIKIIGKDNVGWSIDKDRKNSEFFLSKINNVSIVNSFFQANVLYFVWYNLIIPWRFFLFFYKKIFKKKIIAVTTNDITNHINNFYKLKKIVDVWISPGNKISAFFKEQKVDFVQIPFYVSPKKFFKIKDSKKNIAKKLGIDHKKFKDKILIGSFQRDSLGADLNKPKWQKNPDLLINLINKLPKEKILLILAGPRRHYIINQCRKNNINYLFIGDKEFVNNGKDDVLDNNLNEYKMNLLYNLIDIYIVSSKSEGGPKAILEASLTETLIFSTDVGFSKDFIHKDLIYYQNNLQKVVDFILKYSSEGKNKAYIKYNYINAINILEKKNYLKLFKNIFIKEL